MYKYNKHKKVWEDFFNTIFATKYDYELIEMEDLKIKVEEKGQGAF